jgi:serine/threonine-protein kinase
MPDDAYPRLKNLFEQLLDMQPEERPAFIVGLGDEELGRKLEALLDSHTDSGDDKTRSIITPLFQFDRAFSTNAPAFAPDELLLDRFRVVRFIGRGGMGEVYEAEDLQLGRVALKTIRADLSGQAHMMARFRQEVQLARKVTSVNVCRIHEFFELPTGGQHGAAAFLTMEFLEGITLSDRVRRQGPLPLDEAGIVLQQLCAGVQAVHEAGVIHRDIKSSNVMLAKRMDATQAVVMDLGLARESSDGPDARTELTMPGAVMGTMQYAAPEQLAAGTVTPATDIYALGVVLYEIVTGKLPFHANTLAGAALERMKRPPAPSSLRGGVPKFWDEVVCRCLDHEPEKRYQSARELSDALKGRPPKRAGRLYGYAAAALIVVAAAAGVARLPLMNRGGETALKTVTKRVAVLPFTNIGDDPANRIASDGLLEALTSRISEMDVSGEKLSVVPASEVRQRKVTGPLEAIRQLGANLVVTGSLQRDGKNIRLTLNLVDPRNSRQLGSATVSEKEADYSSLEDSAAAKLAALLGVDQRAAGLTQHPRTGSTAYEHYLEAMGYVHQWDQPGNLEKAIALFQLVVQDDPEFHLGLAGLAHAYQLRYALDHDHRWVDLAMQAANLALQADPKLEPVYVTLGRLHNSAGQYDLSREEFQRALDLAPRDPEAIQGMAQTFQRLGRNNEAEAMFRRATELRPDSWEGYFRLGNFYYAQSQYREAESQYRRALEIEPDNAPVFINLGTTLTNENRFGEAQTVLEKAVALNPTYSAYNNLASVYYLEGRYEDAAAIYEKSLRLSDTDYMVWGNLAAAYAASPTLASKAKIAFGKAALLAEEKTRETPDATVESQLGTYYAHLHIPDKARLRLSSALAISPDDPSVLLGVSEGYAVLRDRPDARLYLQKAVTEGASIEYAKRIPALRGIANELSMEGTGSGSPKTSIHSP